MNILLDTNILFSALISDGKERLLVSKIIGKRYKIVVTDLILEEINDVIDHKISKEKRIKAKEIITALSESIFVFVKHYDLYRNNINKAKDYINEKDAPILAAGLQKEINFIVSGDKDFVENDNLSFLRGKKIFTTKEMMGKI
jgi:putative PIN family toxin of toxin-antitoxin system